MLFLETVHVKLYGRSRPAHKTCEDGLPYGLWTIWVSRVGGDPGLITGSKVLMVQRSKGFRVPRDKGFRVCRKTYIVYPKGIKRTIFSLSVLDYAKRYYACT